MTKPFPALLDSIVCTPVDVGTDSIWQNFSEVLAPLGFQSIHYESGMQGTESCLKTLPSKTRAFGDLVSREFMEAVFNEPDHYAADDVVQHCAANVIPLSFSTEATESDSRQLRNIKGLAHDFGVTGGIVVPLHGFGDRGFGNVTFMLNRHSAQDLEAMPIMELTALAHTIHGTLASAKEQPMAAAKLSKQEVACLSWVAEGLSTKRLAHRMGISPSTANEYISNACTKLEATTRAEATAKAVALGLVQL